MSRHTISRARAFSTPIVLSLLLLVLVLLVVASDDKAMARSGVEILSRVVVVVGLWIFVGNSGVISFGHAGFMTIGAYASAWLTVSPQMKGLLLTGLPEWLANTELAPFAGAIVAGGFTAFIALLVGAAVLRLSGIAASIATFAFLAIVYNVYASWEPVTAGTSSLVGLPRYVTIWVALGWAIAAIVVASIYANSASGLALRATREDEVAAAASGIDMYRHRVLSLVISAFFTGIGGALLGHMIGVLSPESFYLGITFLTLAMLVVGGIGTLTGAVLGVLTISIVIELLLKLETGVQIGTTLVSLPVGAQEVLIGLGMILVLILRPLGLSGGRELRLPARFFPRSLSEPTQTNNQQRG